MMMVMFCLVLLWIRVKFSDSGLDSLTKRDRLGMSTVVMIDDTPQCETKRKKILLKPVRRDAAASTE